MEKPLVKTVVTSMIGNIFEWYDFALFGYFAPLIGKLFFPSGNKTTELIYAFAIFAIGFLVRPLGGMIFGHIGDRMGRKKAMVLSIMLMAIPTAVIGLLPTYEAIGIMAPLLLCLMRMLQGISMGGNYSGSITFTSEHTSPERRGLIGSLAVTSCLAGLLLGSGTAALFSFVFDPTELGSWGWRIPFLLGIFICFVGIYMRRHVPESPEYLEVQETGHLSKHPIFDVFLEHPSTLTKVVLAVMLHDLSFYILLMYMATHLSERLGLPQDVSLAVNTISLVVVAIFTLVGAWLSDRLGRKTILAIAAFGFVIVTYPLLKVINTSTDVTTILLAQMTLAIAVGSYFGPIPALMVEAFPTSIRFSAIAITTNISGPLFGGTAPLLMTYLIDKTKDNMIPAYFLTVGAIVALIALRFIKSYDIDSELKPA